MPRDRDKSVTVAGGSFPPTPVAGKLRPDISLAANSAKGPPPPLGAMTADELGGLLGIAGRTVRELASQGLLVKGARGRYDAPASVASYCRHLREIAAGRAGDAQAGLTSERARQAREHADGMAMKNAVARGELVSAAEVRMTWAMILADVRAGILAVPTRLPELGRVQIERLDGELRRALEALADA